MSLSSRLCSYYKISKWIIDPRPDPSEDSSDQTKICNSRQSCFFFLNPTNASFLTLSIGCRLSLVKRQGAYADFSSKWFKSIFSIFYPYECSISDKFPTTFLTLSAYLVVERVPCWASTSNIFALTMHVNSPAFLVDRKSKLNYQ